MLLYDFFLLQSLLRILLPALSPSLNLGSRMWMLTYTLFLSLLDWFKSCRLSSTLLHLWRRGLLLVMTIHNSIDPYKLLHSSESGDLVYGEEGKGVEWEMWIHFLTLQPSSCVGLNISLTSFPSFLPFLSFFVLQSPICAMRMVKFPLILPLS